MSTKKFTELDLPESKRWENLTLANDFMFGKVFQDLDLCLELVRLILPELNIERITRHEHQKPAHETMDTKGVRFDVYLHDDKGRIIIVEMQVADNKNLPRRTRVYHSEADLDAMDKNTPKLYKNMPETILIFICAFDPFKLGRHIYTFRNICVEERNLFLDDGASTIFLNTKGRDKDISPELKAFLDLINGKSSDDDFVRRLERRLNYAKQNKYWRQEYLLTEFEWNEAKAESFEEGREEGIAIGEKQGIAIGEERGILKASFDIARSMLKAGFDSMQICALTKLSLDDLKKL